MNYFVVFCFFIHTNLFSQSLLDKEPLLVGSVRVLEEDVPIYKKINREISKFIKEKDSFIFNDKDPRNRDKLFRFPFKDYYKLETFYGEDFVVTPNLVSLYPVEKNYYIAKIMWAFHLENEGTYLHMINNFLVYYDKDNFRLQNITSYNLKNWKRKKVGNIMYLFEKDFFFNHDKADEMLNFHKNISLFFEHTPFDFTYVVCKNTNHMYNTLGYDFHTDMYGSDTSTGSAYVEDALIFSGNNSEIYRHELIHLHINKKFGFVNNFLEEGLATFLGGSREIAYEAHLSKLKKYFESKPNSVFFEICFEGNLDKNTSMPYITAAFICETVYEDCGKEQLFEMLNVVGKDNTKKNLKDYLKSIYEVNTDTDLNQLLVNKIINKND